MKDVKQRYSNEINTILYGMQNIENKRYYDISRAGSDGYLADNIIKLRKDFLKLLDLIEKNAPSAEETLANHMFSKKE